MRALASSVGSSCRGAVRSARAAFVRSAFQRSFVAGMVLTIPAVLVPASGTAQVIESAVPHAPIAAAPAEEYQPCTALDAAVAGWCLERRVAEAARLSAGEFSAVNRECRLVFADPARVERFSCGSLIVRLRLSAGDRALRAIAEAANGAWTDLRRVSWFRSAVLRIAPGTERSALRNIIYHPAVLWVELDHLPLLYEAPQSLGDGYGRER